MTTRKRKAIDTRKYAFVVSPIGKKGTEKYNQFKEVYDYIVKPAIKSCGYELEVIRADDIEKPGSFVKDILENLLNSFIVIADLTGQNPNVFYELGVRHSLSARTILISQSLDDIPSDLREYRTIIYENSAKGVKDFTDQLTNYLTEIFNDPNTPDNPVLDRIGSIIEDKTHSLEAEVHNLKSELATILKKGVAKKESIEIESASVRMSRIFKIKNAEDQTYSLYGGSVVFGEGEEEKTIYLKKEQGDFDLYFLMGEGEIFEYWYVYIQNRKTNIDQQLADIRVLLNDCVNMEDIEFKFVIATNEDMNKQTSLIHQKFKRMLEFVPKKHRPRFSLEIWDENGLTEQEKLLGLKIDV